MTLSWIEGEQREKLNLSNDYMYCTPDFEKESDLRVGNINVNVGHLNNWYIMSSWKCHCNSKPLLPGILTIFTDIDDIIDGTMVSEANE